MCVCVRERERERERERGREEGREGEGEGEGYRCGGETEIHIHVDDQIIFKEGNDVKAISTLSLNIILFNISNGCQGERRDEESKASCSEETANSLPTAAALQPAAPDTHGGC